MLNDLAALTPPLLVCAAFLVAVWAFLRHEMRHADSPPPDESADDSKGSRNPGVQNLNQDAPSGTLPGPDAQHSGRVDDADRASGS